MFLPYRNQNPPESFPWATIGLIVVNVVTYFLTSDMGLSIKTAAAIQGGTSLANFHWYQLFSSMFLHGDPLHLVGNMWFLYLFGFAVEGRMRTPKFLLLYFIAGILGDVAHLLIVGPMNPKVPTIGASGAIMGVMGAAIYMFPYSPMNVFWTFWYRFGSSEWKLWWVGIYYIAFDILEATLTSVAGVRGGVANLAHLGGVAAGFLTCWILRMKRDDEYTSDAKATMHVTNNVGSLSERELRELYKHHPGRTDLVTHWLTKSTFSDGPTRAEAIAAFKTQLPNVLAKEPIHTLCQAVNALQMSQPGALTTRELGLIAARAEREGQHGNAMQYYQAIVNDTRSTQSDREGAAFRVAMLLESAFNDYAQAKTWYEYIRTNYPMSPIIGQVNARLQFLAKQGI